MFKLDKKKKSVILIFAVIILFIGYYFYSIKNNENIIESENFIAENLINFSTTNENLEVQQNIFVYVSGAVNNPGVIEMKSDSRVKDAIEFANGITENADLTNINLAEKLEDESKIYIPEKGQNEQNINLRAGRTK